MDRPEFAPRFYLDEDKNTIADVPEIPGVYGAGKNQEEAAIELAHALAFTVWAERE